MCIENYRDTFRADVQNCVLYSRCPPLRGVRSKWSSTVYD